jgi:PTH1 family peptidyl-tRNA hydrolase
VKLIVGLGNPGEKYRGTRHNLGFMVVEELARRLRVKRQEYKCNAVIAWTAYLREQVILAKPLTYMNLSGTAVKSLVAKFKVDAGELLVISDDLDLEPGRIRLRMQGGAGGHRGLASIIDSLGTEDFNRLRIGVGRPPAGYDIKAHVLTRFNHEEEELIAQAVLKGADAAEVWIREGIVKAMNSYN